MSKRNIFLLLASDVEGSQPLMAFEAKADAVKVAKACAEHEATRPTAPATVEDTPENDAAFDEWDREMNRWRKRHPGGPHAHWYDAFRAHRMRLIPPTLAKG